ncbi:alcohol dehydrogenase catalytic domain-containing protein [Endomicrobium sp. AH-315-J14]|nr:alcohol dehydrogenase catalytic domain-containing protein [Endomicrobium sp. AH-315-J14]
MKVKAAVAYAAKEPLVIEQIDLEGPKDGEVLVEIKATGICHTDAYTLSGADPEVLFPAILGHEGAGVVVEVGPAGSGQEIATRPFQLVTGRVWKGTAFGGARGRTDVPKIVDWYVDGKINIDDLITHKVGIDDINRAFDLMYEGKSIRIVAEF